SGRNAIRIPAPTMPRPTYTLPEIRALIDAFEWPVIVVHERKLVAANDGWLELAGYAREEAEGQPVISFLAPSDRRRLLERTVRRSLGTPLRPGGLASRL